MKKTFTAAILVLVMVFSLCACGDTDGTSTEKRSKRIKDIVTESMISEDIENVLADESGFKYSSCTITDRITDEELHSDTIYLNAYFEGDYFGFYRTYSVIYSYERKTGWVLDYVNPDGLGNEEYIIINYPNEELINNYISDYDSKSVTTVTDWELLDVQLNDYADGATARIKLEQEVSCDAADVAFSYVSYKKLNYDADCINDTWVFDSAFGDECLEGPDGATDMEKFSITGPFTDWECDDFTSSPWNKHFDASCPCTISSSNSFNYDQGANNIDLSIKTISPKNSFGASYTWEYSDFKFDGGFYEDDIYEEYTDQVVILGTCTEKGSYSNSYGESETWEKERNWSFTISDEECYFTIVTYTSLYSVDVRIFPAGHGEWFE